MLGVGTNWMAGMEKRKMGIGEEGRLVPARGKKGTKRLLKCANETFFWTGKQL